MHVHAPFSLPAAYAALGLGFVVQVAYGSPLSANWPAPAFAAGVLYAGAVAAAITLLPVDVGDWLARGRWALLGAAVLLFVALGAFGTAPGASGQTINLWGFQPIEIVKVCAVLSVGATLGARAFKLRWHRDLYFGWFRVPRLRILAVALGMMAAAWLGLLAVRDFGPTLILALVFLGLVYVVTRSPAWVAAAVVFSAVILTCFWVNPDAAPSSSLALRADMWRDPWLNGRPNGDQLALARWALAAGGAFGSGVGAGVAGALPAGHTDLVYAHLVEVLGLSGAGAYLVLLGICVLDGLRIAAHNRTPERVMMAAALGLLIAAQATVILGGTLGWFPLTGVVVPFLSFGKTGSAALLAVVALLVRLGDDGHYRADTEELRELRGGVNALRLGVVAGVVALWVSTFVHAMVGRDETSLRGLVTTLGDGTPVIKHDPRLAVLARKVRRGSILDRHGEVLAASPAAGARVNPMGDKLGTVLGTADSNLARAKWQVEQMLDTRLRGWPNLAQGKTAWVATVGKSRQVVFAAEEARLPDAEQAAEAAARLRARGGEGEPARVRLADPDYAALLPIARMGVERRLEAITALADDVESRSVR
ncbi:MAG: FtsW/RodA/SpoVE family cell cycle protein, partial [Deltaproteobacteria bacterium]|nr:FtsW/RodA/SpoVE family cell cycle protein [Deltaproteobacteria bacterium]